MLYVPIGRKHKVEFKNLNMINGGKIRETFEK
jgi:hypothetical protein